MKRISLPLCLHPFAKRFASILAINRQLIIEARNSSNFTDDLIHPRTAGEKITAHAHSLSDYVDKEIRIQTA